MKKIKIEVDGRSYLIVTKNEKTELGVKGKTTPEKDTLEHVVDLPNILIVTRKNAEVLFVLRGGEVDSFKILTAQELYDECKYQWFEPLADDYRELIYVNKLDEVKDAYRVFTWGEIERFAIVPRASIMFYNKLSGDWKHNPDGGKDYLLALMNEIPYWLMLWGRYPSL